LARKKVVWSKVEGFQERLEELRRTFRPARIRVLLAAESPPAGGTFFYAADSALYRHTGQAFTKFLALKPGDDFLLSFQRCGFYLDDLCLEPVNGMDGPTRRKAHARWTDSFAARLKDYQPAVIVPIMISIDRHVRHSAKLAGMLDRVRDPLPYPGMGNHPRYIRAMEQLLASLSADGLIKSS
jgi:hypothetical protein